MLDDACLLQFCMRPAESSHTRLLPRRHRGRRTLACLACVVGVLALALPADGVELGGTQAPAPVSAPPSARAPAPSPSAPQAPAVPAAQANVAIEPGRPGAAVPRDFLGLSFELSSAGQLAEYANRGDLITLLRSLGPGVLRLGGVSADTRVAWTDRLTPRPAWASGVLDEADLRGLRKLAAASGWRVLLTIGLAHYAPRVAAREAAAAAATLGPWLAGIEVGNEPDSYGHHGLRALPWTAADYETQVSAYRRAIAAKVAGIPVAGPGVSGSLAYERWGPAEIRRQHPALLTGHHYPLRCDSVPAPSIETLLSQGIREKEVQSLARFLAVSHASATAFRMDETNTVSCGGRPGISNTFASALWATGYIAETMLKGATGINFQGNPANCEGYSPLCASSPELLAAGTLHAQPEWYALLMMRSLVGDRPLPTRVLAPAKPNLTVSALRTAAGGLHFVVIEDDPAGSAGASVHLHVGRGFRAATVLSLRAPSLLATTGVSLGGRAVAANGAWQPAQPTPIRVRNGTLTLSIPAASAALVTVAPRGVG